MKREYDVCPVCEMYIYRMNFGVVRFAKNNYHRVCFELELTKYVYAENKRRKPKKERST